MKNKKWRAGTSRSPFSVKVPVNPDYLENLEYLENPENPEYPEYLEKINNQYPLILKNNRLNLSVLVEGYRDVGVGVAALPAAEAPAGGSVEVDLQLRSFSNITDLLRNAFDNAEYGMPRETLSRAS